MVAVDMAIEREPESKPRDLRLSPIFQSTALAIAGLHASARPREIRRHEELVTSITGSVVASSDDVALGIYSRAVAFAWGARSIEGLESLILSGMQDAWRVGDTRALADGMTLLKAFPPRGINGNRPVIFYDRATSMLTVMTVAQYDGARQAILADGIRLGIGLGGPVRLDTQDTAAKGFDIARCARIVERIGIAAGLIVAIAAPEIRLGGTALSIIGRLALGTGAGITSLGGLALGGALGAAGGKFAGVVCDGISSHVSGGGGGGGGSTVPVGPTDLGFGPGEFKGGGGGEPGGGGGGGVPGGGGGQGPISGTVDEGDGFVAVGTEGPQNVTIHDQDGSSQTITTDNNGNTTVTSTDSDGNVTDQQSWDAEGKPTDDGPRPPDDGGYPVPDGDGGGGPFGPASFKPDWIQYPVPDGGGPAGPAARGATFILVGAARLRGF